MNVLLTGANGFVGVAMRDRLLSAGYGCTAVTRSAASFSDGLVAQAVGDISSQTNWKELLRDTDVIIHLAGRAHVFSKDGSNAQHLFDAVNVAGSLNLAKQAIAAGVKRFIYVSSIGVHGAGSGRVAVTEDSPLAPYSPYTQSKYRAELELRALVDQSQMELVIVRPPLVYAGDAPGNFRQLLKLVASGLPLPLAGISNCRSMVARENLVDFLLHCCSHANAANQAFVISDAHDVSTTEIVNLLAEGMGKAPRLFGVPGSLVKVAANLLGRQHIYGQLFGSLQVDSGKARKLLGWQPVISASEALIRAGQSFKASTV